MRVFIHVFSYMYIFIYEWSSCGVSARAITHSAHTHYAILPLLLIIIIFIVSYCPIIVQL